MEAIAIAKLVMVLAQLVMSNFAAAQKVAQMIIKRRSEGRDVTVADLHEAVGDDDAARDELVAAIESAED